MQEKFRLCNLLGHVKICASFDMVISYDQMVYLNVLNAYVRKALLQLKTCCNSRPNVYTNRSRDIGGMYPERHVSGKNSKLVTYWSKL